MPAAVLTASIASDSVQIDGRRCIQEIFTDQYAIAWQRFYLCHGNFDASIQLELDKVACVLQLQMMEIESNIFNVTTFGSFASVDLKYSTPAQNFSALRIVYSSANRIQSVMIGDFLNTLTDAQLQAAFNLTQAQVTSLRTNKLQPAATIANSIRANTGQ